MTSQRDPILAVHDLRTYFKMEDDIVRAVDGVSFELGPGEALGIVGESGSGKTVTCLSAMRLIPQPPGYFPTGEVRFQGKDLLRLRESEMARFRGNEMSMIFQDPMTSLNPFLKVGRQLTEVLEVHQRSSSSEARRLSIEMLARVGIADPERRIDQFPHQFSGGMRQRVMIAMALLCKPKLLFADEPTTALDVTIQAQILELISDLRRDLGTSVVLITHDLGIVAGLTDRVLVMYAGRIVEEGPTEQVLVSPRHPYTQGLLQSIPRLNEASRSRLRAIPGLPPDLSNLPNGCPFHPRCEWATDRCRRDYPEQVSFGDGRSASCWETEALKVPASR